MTLTTPAEVVEGIYQKSAELDVTQELLEDRIRVFVKEEDAYRLAKAKAWGQAEGRSAEERKCNVDAMTSAERQASHLAEWLMKATLESVRNKRAQLTAMQTAANSVKEEAALARTGPSSTF